MSKCIINLSDDCNMVQQICLTENGNVYIKGAYAENLEELNSDYINEHFGDLQDTAYQRGLDDAWEAARKLFSSMADSDIEKAFPTEWNNGGFNALINLQPQEAIEKLKAYEEKQADKIKVGDEVVGTAGHRGFVTKPINSESVYVVWEDGSCGANDLMDLKKTGRTRYDIEKILEAMKA